MDVVIVDGARKIRWAVQRLRLRKVPCVCFWVALVLDWSERHS